MALLLQTVSSGDPVTAYFTNLNIHSSVFDVVVSKPWFICLFSFIDDGCHKVCTDVCILPHSRLGDKICFNCESQINHT